MLAAYMKECVAGRQAMIYLHSHSCHTFLFQVVDGLCASKKIQLIEDNLKILLKKFAALYVCLFEVPLGVGRMQNFV